MSTADPAARAALLAAISIAGAACSEGSAIAVRDVVPAEASARGGDVVTIEGSGLSSATAAVFGGAAGTIVSASDSSITVRVPRQVAGAVDVEVVAGGERASLAQGFTFTPLALRFFDRAPASPALAAADGRAAALADLDGDGSLDVLQAAGTEGVRVMWNDGHGAFPSVTRLSFGESAPAGDVRAIVAADFDGDGAIDVFFGAADAGESALAAQESPAVFVDRTAIAFPSGVGAVRAAIGADVDEDGDIDLVVVGPTIDPAYPGRTALLVNDGGGTFSEADEALFPGASIAASGVAAGDVDGDGHVDLLLSVEAAPLRLYLGDGRGGFLLAPPDAVPPDPVSGPGAPALLDVDGDGRLDVYLPAAGQDKVYWNDGRGRLFDHTAESLGVEGDVGLSAAAVDLDLDGHADLVVANAGAPARLLRNDGRGRLFDYSSALVNDAPSAAGVAVGDVDGDGAPDVFVSRDDLAAPSLFLQTDVVDDADEDGVPDAYDDCPDVADPEQVNRDSLPFGCASRAACLEATGCDLVIRADLAYLFCRSAPLDWAGAAALCAARGAALGTVDDADEDDFLASAGAVDGWLGYTDAATEGTWLSSSGVELGYRDWGEGQPDDAVGAEDCATMTADGTWNDVPCDGPRTFFCKDARAKQPDPGDACDACPDRNEPGTAPTDGAGGASACADERGGGG